MAEVVEVSVIDTVAVEVTSPTPPAIDVDVINSPTVNIDVIGMPGPAGSTDHGALTGLADDDHPQYLNQTRADQRYAIIGATLVEFPTPQSVWTIDLGYICNVIVTNSADQVVEPGTITYSGTSMQLEFSAAFSGTAYCF